MKKLSLILSLIPLLSGCITVPVKDEYHENKCLISSDKKTLKIIDLAKETDSYYSIEGILLSPILIPTSAIISGAYVLVNNIYNFIGRYLRKI